MIARSLKLFAALLALICMTGCAFQVHGHGRGTIHSRPTHPASSTTVHHRSGHTQGVNITVEASAGVSSSEKSSDARAPAAGRTPSTPAASAAGPPVHAPAHGYRRETAGIDAAASGNSPGKSKGKSKGKK